MKNLLIGLMVLGLTSLAYPQEGNGGIEEVVLKGVTLSPVMNSTYRNMVQDVHTAATVKHLEDAVASFDITLSPIYSAGAKDYRITFKNSDGKILAIFDGQGKILYSYEKYSDIALPPAVRQAVYKELPQWNLLRNDYSVIYESDKGVNKIFKIQVGKDNLKKNLKIDSSGNFLD